MLIGMIVLTLRTSNLLYTFYRCLRRALEDWRPVKNVQRLLRRTFRHTMLGGLTIRCTMKDLHVEQQYFGHSNVGCEDDKNEQQDAEVDVDRFEKYPVSLILARQQKRQESDEPLHIHSSFIHSQNSLAAFGVS